MKTYNIPVTRKLSGVVKIEANSLAEAMNIFDTTKDTVPFPLDETYVEDSFARGDNRSCSAANRDDDTTYDAILYPVPDPRIQE